VHFCWTRRSSLLCPCFHLPESRGLRPSVANWQSAVIGSDSVFLAAFFRRLASSNRSLLFLSVERSFPSGPPALAGPRVFQFRAEALTVFPSSLVPCWFRVIHSASSREWQITCPSRGPCQALSGACPLLSMFSSRKI